tara:strand:+ start:7258 stop:8100 length:843 start_codon:yes stop_codon:yes gene_type:complete
MEAYAHIIEELDYSLETLEVEIDDVTELAEAGIKLTKKTLKSIRELVVDKEFDCKEDEICFFKVTKPRIYSKLIYYVKLFNIESKRPKSSNKNQIRYFNNHIDKLQQYLNDNLDFYHYYRRGGITFDEQYFLRGKEDIRLFPDTFHFFTDEQFATSHDSTVATILAYDLLIVYLKREIDKLENNSNNLSLQDLQKQSNITWTAHKIDLIELVYAIHSTDVINNGTVEIKDIARVVERIFKIDLGDYYRAFLEIRMRKNSRTKFLDALKHKLIKRMDEVDN